MGIPGLRYPGFIEVGFAGSFYPERFSLCFWGGGYSGACVGVSRIWEGCRVSSWMRRTTAAELSFFAGVSLSCGWIADLGFLDI